MTLKDVKEIKDKDNKKANKDPLDKIEDDPYLKKTVEMSKHGVRLLSQSWRYCFWCPYAPHQGRTSMPCLAEIPHSDTTVFSTSFLPSPKMSIKTSPQKMFISKKTCRNSCLHTLTLGSKHLWPMLPSSLQYLLEMQAWAHQARLKAPRCHW